MDIQIVPINESQKKTPPEDFAFGSTFSNHMFTHKYSTENGWHEGKIEPYRMLTLDPATTVLHYSQEIFEGTKAYRRPDGNINLFRPWENAKRFNSSAARMSMPAVDVEDHVQAIVQLVEMDNDWVPTKEGATLYIRPTMIGTDPFLGVRASSTYLHYIITGPVGNYYAGGLAPVSVLISDDYRRAAPGPGGTGAAKTGGNYAASILADEAAKKAGYTQVLWLDAKTGENIEEVGTMNIMFVYEGKKIVTPKLTGSILPGITRDSLLTLAPDLGYEVEETTLNVSDMLADVAAGKITEAFGCGTAVVIAPVGNFGYKGKDTQVGDGGVGEVSRRLFDELTAIQFGQKEDPYGWIHTIEVD
ncbi:MAG: branched-chain amino acid aminotransferase [Chloroflexota bacterium]